MESESIKVRVGTKIEEEDAQKLNLAQMGLAVASTPVTPEVEGQHYHQHEEWVRCPWCGHHGRVFVSSHRYEWFRCGHCGGAFRA